MTTSERWAEIRDFWVRVLDGLSRIAAAAMFAGADRLFQIVLEDTIFKSGSLLLAIAEDIGNIAFVLLDLYLLWDMLVVFVPQLKGRQSVQQVVPEGNPNEQG